MRSALRYVALGAIVCFMSAACSRQPEKSEGAVRNVILTEVGTTGETVTKTFSGVVEEGKSVNAAFMTGGKLKSLLVNEGNRVKEGQLIAIIDDSDYQIGVNQLRIQLQQMTAEKERMDEMFARHNIAPNDYEKFDAGYKQLQLQLEMAENKLGYTKLYSPSNGFVSYRYMQPGELVDAGTPIYKITDDSKLEVSADLPLSVFLNRNDIIEVRGEIADNREIPLKIASFSPDADNNQLYHIKLEIPSSISKDLTTGMNMPVIIEMKNRSTGTYTIPSRSIFTENGRNYVWIFNEPDSTLSKKEITIKGTPKENNSFVSGLNGNERIVTAGVKQLEEGEKVNILTSPIE